MLQLLKYLFSNLRILVFLILQVICFFIIIQYNHTQREIFINSSGIVTGSFLESYDNFTHFMNLKDISTQLQDENAKLNKEIYNLQNYISQIQDSTITDTIINKYTFIPATVISNSISLGNNYITINKGLKDGITNKMGVIGKDGIVGIVDKTSDHFSRILSLLHTKSKIAAEVKNKNTFGYLMWNTKSSNRVNLVDVPKHAQVSSGDTIITNGYSLLFPPNIPIGKIKDVSINNDQGFYNIELDLFTNFSSLKNVYIINEIFKEELDSLMIINE